MIKSRLIQAAKGDYPADLVLKNGQVIDVFNGEVFQADIAVLDGYIAGVGQYDAAVQTIDLQGQYISPGLINAHCHVESSMACPAVYCMEESRWGVTTLITDPHEIANVSGLAGIQYMLDASAYLPMNYYMQLPSCVPATSFEHAGCTLSANDLMQFAEHPQVLGLGEMMDITGVLGCHADVLHKLDCFSQKIIDGHAPQVGGHALQAYAVAGIQTDHESISYAEAKEKLRAGIAVLIREGSASQNLDVILSGVLKENITTNQLAFCTDDKHLADIRQQGTIRWCIKKAIALGMEPVTAFQLATINAAQIYHLPHLGAIAPGYQADFAVFDNLHDLNVTRVFHKGKEPAFASAPVLPAQPSVHLAPFTAADLVLELVSDQSYPVIRILPHEIATEKGEYTGAKAQKAIAQGQLCYITVLERHHATGHIGCGLLEGYGLQNGAVATTVAHDSHNLIVAGTNAQDMEIAAREIDRVQGGYTLVQHGKVIDTLPLPIAGLMSPWSAQTLNAKLDKMVAAARQMGVAAWNDPFITLSFMALPVIPKIRITDLGMFDAENFTFYPMSAHQNED